MGGADARLEALLVERARRHRLDPPRPLRDGRRAAEFIRERRIVTVSGRSTLPLLTEAIAGRPIEGSWMADREVRRIWKVMSRIDRERYGLAPARLVKGLETLFDVQLAPAVHRMASDPDRRARAEEELPAAARRLLRRIEEDGRVRMDALEMPAKRSRPLRMLLERGLLVASTDLHTERGYHTAVAFGWKDSEVARRFGGEAGRLTYEGACRSLMLAALRSGVVMPEKEARRLFVFDSAVLDSLIEEGPVDRLVVDGSGWVAPAEGSP